MKELGALYKNNLNKIVDQATPEKNCQQNFKFFNKPGYDVVQHQTKSG